MTTQMLNQRCEHGFDQLCVARGTAVRGFAPPSVHTFGAAGALGGYAATGVADSRDGCGRVTDGAMGATRRRKLILAAAETPRPQGAVGQCPRRAPA